MNNLLKYSIIILVFVGSLLFLRQCNNRQVNLVKEQLINLNKQEVNFWKDKYNNEHLAVEDLLVDKKVMQFKSDSLAKLLGIKSKNIKRFASATSKTEVVIPIHDTVFSEKTNEIIIERKGDSIYIALYDTLTFTNYWKRKWFLGSKKYYTDISNTNSMVKLSGLKTIEIKQKEKNIIIGPSLTFQPINNRFILGFSIIYRPLSIRL